jgi:hypothetical protein
LSFNPNRSVLTCTPTQLRSPALRAGASVGDYSGGASPMVREYVSDPLF